MGMWPPMRFLDLQQLDRWLNDCFKITYIIEYVKTFLSKHKSHNYIYYCPDGLLVKLSTFQAECPSYLCQFSFKLFHCKLILTDYMLLPYCKISKKVYVYILDVLKYHYKINHTRLYGLVRVHGATNRESSLQTVTRKNARASA